MIFFGHRFIESENFYHISSIEAIQNTPPSSTLYIEFSETNLDIITHTFLNSMPTAIYAQNVTQLLYASSFNASFIVVEKELAKTAQNVAENYLFDAKILVLIEKEDEIEELALLGVDGVVFSNTIIKINS
ncbi:MAG: hypothetical protein A3E21_04055 [Sulfurimonas sp. RIFCSPHIGHO2_12_FULL_36_9]|uniref:hypothetical protein n=1 Tax=Sulfurimonas sp. RIFCSPLOWO2_12_36_12 TaxID=1802253 RepID=UPI0008B0F6D7|nr:hypothetical protein [Sulfurimonas sp. RIFCSPLOWO2_12_36_12]OHD99469.1 MAG: hypothetical protein A3E21_04055 [Sulfurimonas sp. RIFCSPHIGHO2_12_FULL_36_9]OHE00367.1 MAG: hypothetical protein A3J26_00185 [Sulfurimonas sp. RIFCSPLOWO2_02_FULL_36_28]OHE02926.1 MAG: hypothetical protein A2W82_07350 [Sulfurimonas sp. RIFCSPLOWO2_12_36_12]OHE03140.1 MAG: hypothetical protein A3K14_07835 [Sulfurimonas sp. RIFCSPLOWO2_12_FULL_36_74]